MIDVNHIAKLARLGITKEEEEKFGKELSSILDFVAKLSEANIKDVEPMAQATGVLNVFRADEIDSMGEDKSIKEGILKNAPQKERGFYKVRRVLE